MEVRIAVLCTGAVLILCFSISGSKEQKDGRQCESALWCHRFVVCLVKLAKHGRRGPKVVEHKNGNSGEPLAELTDTSRAPKPTLSQVPINPGNFGSLGAHFECVQSGEILYRSFLRHSLHFWAKRVV